MTKMTVMEIERTGHRLAPWLDATADEHSLLRKGQSTATATRPERLAAAQNITMAQSRHAHPSKPASWAASSGGIAGAPGLRTTKQRSPAANRPSARRAAPNAVRTQSARSEPRAPPAKVRTAKLTFRQGVGGLHKGIRREAHHNPDGRSPAPSTPAHATRSTPGVAAGRIPLRARMLAPDGSEWKSRPCRRLGG